MMSKFELEPAVADFLFPYADIKRRPTAGQGAADQIASIIPGFRVTDSSWSRLRLGCRVRV